jgi:hypothetical protein
MRIFFLCRLNFLGEIHIIVNAPFVASIEKTEALIFTCSKPTFICILTFLGSSTWLYLAVTNTGSNGAF